MNSKRFGFVLLPEFALLPLSCMVDTLEDANYVSERRLYDWCSLSVESAEVTAANGLRLATDCDIRDAPPLDSVVVCSAFNAHLHRSPRLNRWLNRQFESGARVGAIATGSWQLAYAGLLEGRRCTIHWEDLPSFRETFPILDVSDAIFEIDGPVFTCSGGTGAIDLFLRFVSDDYGTEIAAKVAQQIMYPNVRRGDEHQPADASTALHVQPRGVANAGRSDAHEPGIADEHGRDRGDERDLPAANGTPFPQALRTDPAGLLPGPASGPREKPDPFHRHGDVRDRDRVRLQQRVLPGPMPPPSIRAVAPRRTRARRNPADSESRPRRCPMNLRYRARERRGERRLSAEGSRAAVIARASLPTY